MGSMCSKSDQDKTRLRKIRPPPPQALVKNRSPQSTKFQTQQQLQQQQFDRNRYKSNDNLDNKEDYQQVPKLSKKKSKSNDPARIAAIPSHLRANGAGHSRKSLLDRIVNIQSPTTTTNNNNDYGATNVMCAPSTPTYVVTPTADTSRKVTLLELWDEQRKTNGLESVLDKHHSKVQIPKPVHRSVKSIQTNNREASKSMNRIISFSSNESSRSILSKTINSDPATTKPFRPNHSVVSPGQDSQNVRFDTKNSNRQSKFNNKDNRNRSTRKSPLYEVDLGTNLGKCYYTDANTVFVETKSTKLRNPSSKIGNNGSMVQSNNDWVLVEVINNRDDKPGSITTVSQIESQKPNHTQSSTSGQLTNAVVAQSNHSVKSQIKLASQLAKSSALADDDEVSTEIFDHISILSNKNNNNKTSVLKESNHQTTNEEESDQQVPAVHHQDDQCKNDVTNLYQRESITNIVHGIVKRNQETRIRRKSLLDLRASNRKSRKNRDKSPISPRQMTTTIKNKEQPTIDEVAPSGGEKENDDATLNNNNNKDNIKGYQSSGLNGQPGGGANGGGGGGATSSNVNSRFSSLFS